MIKAWAGWLGSNSNVTKQCRCRVRVAWLAWAFPARGSLAGWFEREKASARAQGARVGPHSGCLGMVHQRRGYTRPAGDVVSVLVWMLCMESSHAHTHLGQHSQPGPTIHRPNTASTGHADHSLATHATGPTTKPTCVSSDELQTCAVAV